MEPCAHQNGPITGYSVRYGEMGSGSTQNTTVSGEDSIMTTISGLTNETVYTVEVAAETRAGTGVYSLSVTLTFLHLLVVLLLEETGMHQMGLEYFLLMSQELP